LATEILNINTFTEISNFIGAENCVLNHMGWPVNLQKLSQSNNNEGG